MEKLYDEGLVRAIGVSNFEAHHLDRLRTSANVLPVVDQLETHPHFPNHLLHRYLEELHIVHQAWSPLGRGGVLQEQILIDLAKNTENHLLKSSFVGIYKIISPLFQNQKHLQELEKMQLFMILNCQKQICAKSSV